MFLSSQAYWGKRCNNSLSSVLFPTLSRNYNLLIFSTMMILHILSSFSTFLLLSPHFHTCLCASIYNAFSKFMTFSPQLDKLQTSGPSNLLQLQTNDKGSRLQILLVPTSSHSRTTSAFYRFFAVPLKHVLLSPLTYLN